MFERKNRGAVRPIIISGEVAEVTLTKGFVAIIDAADAEFIGQWNWTLKDAGLPYAYRNAVSRGRQTNILMHRAIMNPADGMVVDHINRNTMDNRRANLRVCAQRENTWNRAASRADRCWQLIHLAPLDGSSALLALGCGGCEIGAYDTAGGCWRTSGVTVVVPSHWMELPPHPIAVRRSAGEAHLSRTVL